MELPTDRLARDTASGAACTDRTGEMAKEPPASFPTWVPPMQTTRWRLRMAAPHSVSRCGPAPSSAACWPSGRAAPVLSVDVGLAAASASPGQAGNAGGVVHRAGMHFRRPDRGRYDAGDPATSHWRPGCGSRVTWPPTSPPLARSPASPRSPPLTWDTSSPPGRVAGIRTPTCCAGTSPRPRSADAEAPRRADQRTTTPALPHCGPVLGTGARSAPA